MYSHSWNRSRTIFDECQFVKHSATEPSAREVSQNIILLICNSCSETGMPHSASSIPQLISKKDEILDSPCVTHPLIKPETRKM